jgi:VIT1/CCC1 family predicted Fe2+/Mn2+ transporter
MPVLPSRARFLADFTLGFADGLTVPFALTAGLSSLGRTDTVVYAGVAEICAGSISMGIGGYLSAKGDAAANAERTSEEGDEEEDDDMEVENGLVAHADADADETEKIHGPDGLPVEVLDYVRVLELPPRLLQLVAEHVREKPHVSDAVAAIAKPEGDGDARPCSPVMVGLSVSLGYVLGGLLPLFPYFFVDRVADGVYWSFAVCLAALFAFGFIKDYVLNCQRREKETKQLCYERRRCRRWADIRRSSWEGFQMVILGGVAALAAVLCVGFFEGFREAPSDVS